jgi:acetyltransferase
MRISLRDGSQAEIRPLRPDDKRLLVAGFERLSPESRYRRFLSATNWLSSDTLRYLTEMDHHDHEALVALASDGTWVGVARYVRSRTDPASAEAAVTVADDWHGRGLGTALTGLLARRAREERVHRFTAVMLAENRDMFEVLQEVGPVRVIARESGTIEAEANLTAPGIGDHVREVLRSAAKGDVQIVPRHAPR